MKNIILKVFKNEYIYSITTRFITLAIGFIQSVLVARYLGAELKGVNAYIASIASVGSIVITFGMHQAYPYLRKKYGIAIYDDYISAVVSIFFVYLVLGIALTFLVPCQLEIKAVFIIIPILGYSRVVGYITLVEHPNKRNTWWTVISAVELIYVMLLWLMFERSVLLAISILVFADIMKAIVYTVILRVRLHFHKGLLNIYLELVKFGFFPMLALLMTTLNYKIDVLMLHHYENITDSMIGVYSIGLSLSDKIVLIPDTLKGVLVSRLVKGADNHEVAKVTRLGLWSSLLICLLIFIVGKPIITILYGKEYIDSYEVVLITSFGLLAVSYFKLIAQYNIVNKRQKLNVAMLSIAIIVDVIFNMVFIPVWGINGAAFATSLGNFICGIVFIIYFSKVASIPLTEMIMIQKKDLDYIYKMMKRNRNQ